MHNPCQNLEELFHHIHARSRVYQKGQDITGPGPADTIHFLKEGIVKVYYLTPDGESTTVNILRPHCFFPIIATLSDKPNRYFYHAITRTHTLTAPTRSFTQALPHHPQVMSQIISFITAEWDTHLIKNQYLIHANAKGRLCHILKLLAKNFGRETKGGTRITIPLTHQQLADLAGLSRETVTRHLGQLKDQNLLTHQDQRLTLSYQLKKMQNYDTTNTSSLPPKVAQSEST